MVHEMRKSGNPVIGPLVFGKIEQMETVIEDAATGEHIATIHEMIDESKVREPGPYGRLFAASQDLLEAAKDALVNLEAIYRQEFACEKHGQTCCIENPRPLEKLRAAIKKATV